MGFFTICHTTSCAPSAALIVAEAVITQTGYFRDYLRMSDPGPGLGKISLFATDQPQGLHVRYQASRRQNLQAGFTGIVELAQWSKHSMRTPKIEQSVKTADPVLQPCR